MEKTLEKATQAYNKYWTKIEEMIYKNRERIQDEKIVKRSSCGTRDFSNANPMDREKILKNEAKCKYFIGLFPEHFYFFYLISWKKQNML